VGLIYYFQLQKENNFLFAGRYPVSLPSHATAKTLMSVPFQCTEENKGEDSQPFSLRLYTWRTLLDTRVYRRSHVPPI
jgi:hypothetical protein